MEFMIPFFGIVLILAYVVIVAVNTIMAFRNFKDGEDNPAIVNVIIVLFFIFYGTFIVNWQPFFDGSMIP